jgi:hypothetical protein
MIQIIQKHIIDVHKHLLQLRDINKLLSFYKIDNKNNFNH